MRCAELGTPVVQSTLANYKSAGLIHPPVVQSMGRKVGKISTYRDEVPYEIYTAQRLSGPRLRVFRWNRSRCSGPNGWPAAVNLLMDCRSTCMSAAALCCGDWSTIWPKSACRWSAKYLFFFYPPQQMSQIIDYVKRQEPDSLTEDLPTDTKSETGEELRGLVLLRRKGDGHHLLALLL